MSNPRTAWCPADVSLIVPARNEAAGIDACLAAAAHLAPGEIIVVDGDSSDGTTRYVRDWAAGRAGTVATRLLCSSPGRALQMNAGAAQASGRILLFLHADTRLEAGALEAVCKSLDTGALWGRFDVRIHGRARLLRLVAHLMNLRSRLSGIATGDQAIFVRRDVFEFLRGYRPMPLMEDLEFCRRLKRLGPPAALRQVAQTSGRRWEAGGVVRTVVRMWLLRLAWALGVDPVRLARFYPDARDPC